MKTITYLSVLNKEEQTFLTSKDILKSEHFFKHSHCKRRTNKITLKDNICAFK